MFGAADDGLWWCVGDWMPRAADSLSLGPAASRSARGDERARRIRERRETGRSWAEELVRARLGGAWPGFAPTPAGAKPRLNGAHGLDVSISHSGPTMLVALALGAQVGADVEAAPFDAFARPQLVRRMCSPSELEALAAVPEGAVRRRALARAWTVKEATLKARGIGLAEDPRTVEVDLVATLADVAQRSIGGAAGTRPELTIVRFGADGAELRHPLA
ncbi:4'-phosphopantetheinyl transferase superfamily protein [Agromyces sp. CF514]|uniref:4'-phosphopantetheinyl transferase family protein n=1 Tax=Agromyces sp. CF514 TaxID=1881031 RepID=UPI001160BCE3|nr:4'-phosphopantetheinyl transferase superfamily protein [Agromyces sp. CF514]